MFANSEKNIGNADCARWNCGGLYIHRGDSHTYIPLDGVIHRSKSVVLGRAIVFDWVITCVRNGARMNLSVSRVTKVLLMLVGNGCIS